MRLRLPRRAVRPAVFRGLTAVAALALTGGVVSAVATPRADAATGCQVDYSVQNQWPGGFTAAVTVTNLGGALSNWKLEWDFPVSGQTVASGWSGQYSQSGSHVTVTNESWNGAVASGGTVSLGFNGTWSGSNPAPKSFTLNGTTCNGGTTPPTTPPPTTTPPTSPPPSNGEHVDNPYAGAKFYVNPEWSQEASGDGGSAIANESTAIWLDSIAAIDGSNGKMGLADQLDHAESEASSSAKPITIEFVIYDLPGRDCAAIASNGELGPTEIGTYETSYIDPIAQIMSQSKYANLRISTIIEPDSLPNLVTNAGGTNTSTSECETMKQNGNYVTGVQYALNKLHAIPNVYTYLDIAHSGWLGWSTNMQPAVQLFASTVQGTTDGFNSLDGFISDTANYTPVTEPFLPDSSLTVGGQQVESSDFYQWNPYLDEKSYDQAMYSALVSAGFPSSVGMLIDTSRDGWGGPDRPTQVSTSGDLNTYVNESRIDKRPSRGDWCNQDGAGIGIRPVASPATHFDAYVWIKPPGESDGSDHVASSTKGIDSMCDPNFGGNARNNNSPTNALPDSPVSGQWFSAQFHQLIANAYPAL